MSLSDLRQVWSRKCFYSFTGIMSSCLWVTIRDFPSWPHLCSLSSTDRSPCDVALLHSEVKNHLTILQWGRRDFCRSTFQMLCKRGQNKWITDLVYVLLSGWTGRKSKLFENLRLWSASIMWPRKWWCLQLLRQYINVSVDYFNHMLFNISSFPVYSSPRLQSLLILITNIW